MAAEDLSVLTVIAHYPAPMWRFVYFGAVYRCHDLLTPLDRRTEIYAGRVNRTDRQADRRTPNPYITLSARHGWRNGHEPGLIVTVTESPHAFGRVSFK